MQPSPFNCISSDVLMPLIDWCPGQVPSWLPFDLALVSLNETFCGIFYIYIYDPLAILEAIEINQILSKVCSEVTFQQMKHEKPCLGKVWKKLGLFLPLDCFFLVALLTREKKQKCLQFKNQAMRTQERHTQNNLAENYFPHIRVSTIQSMLKAPISPIREHAIFDEQRSLYAGKSCHIWEMQNGRVLEKIRKSIGKKF